MVPPSRRLAGRRVFILRLRSGHGFEFLVLSWGEKSFYPSIRPRTWFLVFIELCVSKGTSLFRAVIIDIRPIEPVLLVFCENKPACAKVTCYAVGSITYAKVNNNNSIREKCKRTTATPCALRAFGRGPHCQRWAVRRRWRTSRRRNSGCGFCAEYEEIRRRSRVARVFANEVSPLRLAGRQGG